MALTRLSIDYETFCRVNLPDVGVSRYTRHPTFEILMGSWAFDDGPVQQASPAEGQDFPPEFREALVDPEVEKWAWNAPFEICSTQHGLGVPLDVRQWRDTMVLALTCSLPGKLERAAPIVDLGEDMQKMADGRRLIKKFSAPRTPSKMKPWDRTYWFHDLADWQLYLDYNRQDVVTERAVRNRLISYQPNDWEWDMWHRDQIINEAGVPISRALVDNAVEVYETLVANRLAEMREITGLANPNSQPQLLPWLQDQGYPFDDCQKGHIHRALERLTDGEPVLLGGAKDLARVLELRLEVARASPKKFHALQRATDEDGMLRYALQFAGAARTWRWAGRIWQPQNLPRPTKKLEKKLPAHADNLEHLTADEIDLIYDRPMDLIATCVRPAAQATSGMMLIDADLNAIENRVLGWLAQCPKILEVFEKNLDPYIAFAVYLFGRPYQELMDEYKGGNSYFRTIAKPGVLGCGYMLGAGEEHINYKTGEREATGLLGYAWVMQVREFTLEQSKLSVETFRREFEEVKDYWYGIERAAKKCISSGKAVEFGVGRGPTVVFDRKGPFMRMRLPSGRHLHYLRPRIEKVRMPWGDYKDSITYEGQNERKQWVRESTHPGKLTENADQAISRDLLAHGIKLAQDEGIDVRLHVHDQIVGLVPEDRADEQLKVLRQCMETQPWWAKSLPLGSAGFTSKVFMKD